MSVTLTEVTAKPSLREVVLDALVDAYWYRKGEVEDCRACGRSPAGVCADEGHQLSNVAALEYEEARKRIEHSPADPEVTALDSEASGLAGKRGMAS